MSASTDAMYNAESRYLHTRYLIHFSNTNILEVLRSNYLVSADILEESYKASNSAFGDVTSNELELGLYNANNIFSPDNANGPYSGLIRKGIKIEAFIRPDEVDEWDPAGVFYVSSWSVASTGSVADVRAYDALYSVINGPVPTMPVYRNVPFKTFIEDFFSLFNLQVIVDASITLTLNYAFTSGYTSNRALLNDLLTAALADCFCDHSGVVHIVSKRGSAALRATLTDNDQIISITRKQTIEANYDSAAVTICSWQDSAEKEVLNLKELVVPAGTSNTAQTTFSSTPVTGVRSIRSSVKPISFVATADNIVVTLQSTEDTITDVSIVGIALDKVESEISTPGNNPLKVTSNFIQSKATADDVCNYSDTFVKAVAPTLELSIRGNPLLQLGDTVLISSSKYAINYTGIIIKANYKYTGGLTCDLKLIAAQN